MDKRTIIGTAVVVVVVAAGAVGGASWWQEYEARREAKAAAAKLLAAADQARADQIRIESASARAVANAEIHARLDQRTARALDRLKSDDLMTQCEAALQLGRLGARMHAAALAEAMSSSQDSVRVCAASALVTLGESATAMQAYTEWAESTDTRLKRSALIGFGNVGPTAATVALPHLAEALQSPHMDVRFLAVDSLSKLGPAAAPLLEQASKDTDRNVREYAVRALAASRR